MVSENADLVFFVNGVKIVESSPDPEMTLMHYVRDKLKLTGTKNGCAEGGCGACTVMISEYDPTTDQITHRSINSCLTTICSVHLKSVTTVEGIGSTKTGLHPVQERLSKAHGSQCGFCTPGFIMAMYTLLRNNPKPTKHEIENSLQGNLCRCTGYRPILEGFYTFAEEGCCKKGADCCRNRPIDKTDTEVGPLTDWKGIPDYDPTQDVIFPPELKVLTHQHQHSVQFKGGRTTWYIPHTLEELLQLKRDNNQAKLIIGNTEIRIEQRFKNAFYPVLIQPTSIGELKLTATKRGIGGDPKRMCISLGSSLTLTDMERQLRDNITSLPECSARSLKAIVKMLEWFAGKHVRNAASFTGNIMTASPISDLNPLFLALQCELHVAQLTANGNRVDRNVQMDENFFVGYRKTCLSPAEVIVSLTIPYSREDEFIFGYKQSPRREDDIATVNAGFFVQFHPGTNRVANCRLVFGGMAPTTKFALKSAAQMVDRTWDDQLLESTLLSLRSEMELKPGTPGGMEQYRLTLCLSFFFKFYAAVKLELLKSKPHLYPNETEDSLQSAALGITEYEPMQTTQLYEEVPKEQKAADPIGRPIMHSSGAKHTTGEAIYCDDVQVPGEVYMCLVISKKAHANILSVDTSAALLLPGVIAYVDHKDVPTRGRNFFKASLEDMDRDEDGEKFFATDKVYSEGQVIGAIVADTRETARRAANLVQVTYQELKPLLTIDDAIEANSYFEQISFGADDVDFDPNDSVLSGQLVTGAQEHFYFEPIGAIAIPQEDDNLTLVISGQAPAHYQHSVAEAVGISANNITVKVRRLGGGFGGKESRVNMVVCPLAVAAKKVKRPVRCILERDEDMTMSGTRNPFRCYYKVGYTKEGKITALKMTLYNNGGHSVDLSVGVLHRAVQHVQNAYRIDKVSVKGYSCKTNTSSNTAFRGFGAPQAMFFMEEIITKVAHTIGKTPEEVKEMNLFRPGDATFYKSPLVDCQMIRTWEICLQRSNFADLRKSVDKFNRENRWIKKGVAVVPTTYGIGWPLVKDQAGALVMIYVDGSVLLNHGGIEMGQGLYTKMLQIASTTLGVPIDCIITADTTTDKIPNTSPTAGSTGSDLNGMAVKMACDKLVKRLQPIKDANPNGTWQDWIHTAFHNRVNLCAHAFYKTENRDFFTQPHRYFTYGAACSVVEVDTLTGDHKVLETHLVMDVGRSLNPAVDIGQVEGAFMQGYGLFTMEEHKYSPTGNLITKGPGMYKIPSPNDVGRVFNCYLLQGSEQRAVDTPNSSKGVGEPPLFLGSSVFFAIRDAVGSARRDNGLDQLFDLSCPATAEQIRLACGDKFVKMAPRPQPGTYTPWSIRL